METEILHPQDCLNRRFRSSRSISSPSSCRQAYANPNPRSDHKRRDSKKYPNPSPNPILRRGREFRGNDRKKTVTFEGRDPIGSGIGRLETRDVYAGSAFSQSPSPSSLPLPTFSRRREGLAVVDDTATRDLRRLLRIG